MTTDEELAMKTNLWKFKVTFQTGTLLWCNPFSCRDEEYWSMMTRKRFGVLEWDLGGKKKKFDICATKWEKRFSGHILTALFQELCLEAQDGGET